MVVDVERYRNNFSFVEYILLKEADNNVHEVISRTAVSTQVPVIVVYIYAGEILNRNFDAEINKLVQFYRVTEIKLAKKEILG